MSLKTQLEDIQLLLNKSYEKLEYHKETLNQQAERVKEQIINNIVMQIDALNQRKNWLVNQLDLVKCDKMDSIQRQQDAVKCSIINVKKFIIDQKKYTHVQIKEELEKINNLLSEETQPFLAFRSDSVALREIISQYGAILKQYSGHFADPARPSISLPRVVEEEDDDENMPFTRRYDGQNKSDQIYIGKHATNSAIVRAWLMTTSETCNESNVNIIESDAQKSDLESFVRVDSSDSMESKRINNEFVLQNESKDLWLQKNNNSAHLTCFDEPMKPLTNVEKQNKNIWLLESNSVDEEKEVDHCELVKKVCQAGNCKSFYDCCEIENCCHRLIDSAKPSWNKWLIDNHVINSQMLNAPSTITVTNRSQFASHFNKVLNTDNEKWLDKRKGKRYMELEEEKMNMNSDLWLSNKISKLDTSLKIDSFNAPLEKWICRGRAQEWSKNKEQIIDFAEKSVEKLVLDDVDGLMNENNCKNNNGNNNSNIDYSKWLASRLVS